MELREIVTIILLILLIVCAVAVNLTGNLLQAVIIFMAYSFMMSLVWILMESPDLGITEAAVGAGISGTLFLMTLRKIHAMEQELKGAIEEQAERGAASSLLALLPMQFTTADLIKLRVKNNQSVTPTSIRMLLSRWKRVGRIVKVGDGEWKRLQ